MHSVNFATCNQFLLKLRLLKTKLIFIAKLSEMTTSIIFINASSDLENTRPE